MSCIYKSITLTEGETFVLPPGAELVGASDTGAITSTNDCAPTDNLEALLCYQMIFSLNSNVTPSVNLENTDATTSVSIDLLGVEYLVAQSSNPSNAQFTAALTSAGLTGIITNTSLSIGTTGSRWNFVYYFKTIPSVASNVKIHIVGPGYYDGTDPNDGLFVYPQESTC